MTITNSSLLKFAIRIAPFIILISCISPIDFRVENRGGQLVVSGQVSSLADRNEIRLGRTADGRLPFPITGATIQLLDNMGNSLLYNETEEGVYKLFGFEGTPGQTYHIQIALNDGEVYESIPEKMPEYSAPLTVSYEFVEEITTDADGANLSKRFVKLYAATSLPPAWKDRFVNWTVNEVFLLSPTDFPDPFGSIPPPCFVAQKAEANRIALFDGNKLSTTDIKKQLICSRQVDRTFLEKHYFTTHQSFITKEAHTYWNKVNILANQTGSIFDTPPAQIIGNISNVNEPTEKVWGYFQATNETLNRIYLLPSDFPYTLLFADEVCTYSGDRKISDYPTYCLNCLLYKNSSYSRPDWF
jgi:hypothetical protein